MNKKFKVVCSRWDTGITLFTKQYEIVANTINLDVMSCLYVNSGNVISYTRSQPSDKWLIGISKVIGYK